MKNSKALNSEQLAELAVTALGDMKGQEIRSISVQGLTSITDFMVKGFMGKHYNVRYSFILWFRFRFQCGFSFNFWFRFHVSALSLSLSLSLSSLPPSLCVCVCGRVCVQWKQAMENYHEACHLQHCSLCVKVRLRQFLRTLKHGQNLVSACKHA